MCQIIGVVIGGIITLLVSIYFYRRASIDLKNEANKLLKSVRLILRALEEGKIVEWTKDKNGEPIGVTLKISVADGIKVESDVSATLQAIQKNN